ncbi:hypothetical protein [Leifsonia sp. A12D58]|uniref:hypothetical protein n=1 Tax=Leifsonia sp. A12D58 TaxID=3397674 RepID=UPI0039E15B96
MTDDALAVVTPASAPQIGAHWIGARWVTATQRTMLFLLITASAALVGLLRIPAITRGTLWAEDGQVFIAGAANSTTLLDLFAPYDGYVHVVPRSIAAVVVWAVPVDDWAVAVTVASCLVVGLVTALVFVLSRTVVAWLPARVVIAAITVLVPTALFEVAGNTANLHWYFLWLAPWLLLYRPTSRWAAWLLGVVGLIAALSEIQMALFLPLILWKFRDGIRWPIRVGIILGVIAQGITTLLFPRAQHGVVSPLPDVMTSGYLVNSVLPLFLESGQAVGSFIAQFGWLTASLLVLPFVAACIVIAMKGSTSDRVLGAALLGGSLVTFSAGYVLNPNPTFTIAADAVDDLHAIILLRYGVTSSMLLLALLPAAAMVLWRGARGSRTAAIVAISLAALVLLAHFAPAATTRATGPEWSDSIRSGAIACEADATAQIVRIPIAPADGWAVVLSCDDVEPSGQDR